jgi:glutathione S-transferase
VITLYQFPTSPFCEKVRRALKYKGLNFEIVNVARDRVAEIAHVSPSGKVPAIEHEGMAVQDSTDILYYLDDVRPAPPLFPRDQAKRAMVQIIEDWADESLFYYEVVTRLAWEHNAVRVAPAFAASKGLSESEALTWLTKAAGELTRTQGIGRKPREVIVQDIKRHLDSLSALLANHRFLVGDKLTAADLSVLPQLNAILETDEGQQLVKGRTTLDAWRRAVDALAPS